MHITVALLIVYNSVKWTVHPRYNGRYRDGSVIVLENPRRIAEDLLYSKEILNALAVMNENPLCRGFSRYLMEIRK